MIIHFKQAGHIQRDIARSGFRYPRGMCFGAHKGEKLKAKCAWGSASELCYTSDTKLALLLLNQPLKPELEIFHQLWSKAAFKATVDGGTNELYDNMAEQRGNYLPNLITGDFDSARPEVLQFYKEKAVEIINTPDQDDTDFTKCLKIVIEQRKNYQVDCIVVLGAFGGRLDQQFANINTLFIAHQLAGSVPVYLLSSQSIACLLQKGSHRLKVDSGLEGESCGLVPIAGQCNCITTTGLKWNLEQDSMCFGGLISTSNTCNGANTVTVETDGPLLWMMNLKTNSAS